MRIKATAVERQSSEKLRFLLISRGLQIQGNISPKFCIAFLDVILQNDLENGILHMT